MVAQRERHTGPLEERVQRAFPGPMQQPESEPKNPLPWKRDQPIVMPGGKSLPGDSAAADLLEEEDFSSIEAEEAAINTEPVAIPDVIDAEAEELLPVASPAESVDTPDAESITIKLSVPALLPPEQDIPDSQDEEDLFAYLFAPPPLWQRKPFIACLCALLVLTLGITGTVIAQTRGMFAPTTAFITITPKTRTLSHPFQVSFSQVNAKQLPSATRSGSLTVPTTGTNYQPAVQAHGGLIFFNPLTYPVRISAATTVLVGGDGIHVILDSDVVVPAAQPPLEGQISASAHAMVAGAAGNIAALDLNGQCCSPGMLVRNPAAFSGGQDRVPFQAVSAQDIQQARTSLVSQLQQDSQQALQGQLQEGQSLLDPTCSTQSQSDRQVGAAASHVTVTVGVTCQGLAYTTALMQQIGAQAFASNAPYVLPSGGTLQVSGKAQGNTIAGKVSATLVYQWKQGELLALIHRLAGKPVAQAMHMLAAYPGISHFILHLSSEKSTVMPDAKNITIGFAY